ncbi:MAG: methyl-accepting chemotaxis protein [Spirochaetia bacterium]|nr:methyl-accepting chemotaxis protein [Spirochaetia bacterium]
MQKLSVAGAALEIVLLAINLITGTIAYVYGAVLVAAALLVVLLVRLKPKSSIQAERTEENIDKFTRENQLLQEKIRHSEVQMQELKADLREKDEYLHKFAVQCRKIAEATDAEKIMSKVIVDKTETATLELTNHVYSIGDWSKDVDDLIQRVFGQLTSEEGGLRVQSVRMEEELRRIEQLIQEFKIIRDDYIGELEMIEKTMKSVDQFTDTITDLSERTNLLAINASIEAARAGQAGRGFAVIAAEVQGLAKSTMKIADEISTTIESSVHTVKDSIGTYGERLQNAVEKLARSGEKHAGVIEQLTPQIDRVSEVIEESQKLSSSVTKNINDVTVHLQYQDSVRQILQHMVQLFETLAQEGVDFSAENVQLSQAEIEQQADEVKRLLKSFFTTREEWQAFGHEIDEDLFEGTDESDTQKNGLNGDITLF